MGDNFNWQYRANCLVPVGKKLPSGIIRYAAALEYDGSDFCGWQHQPHCESVQSKVEAGLTAVANEPISVVCAGRTDAHVHATQQFIHFDSTAIRDSHNWVLGGNAHFPDSVRCLWAGTVPESFHARFSAVTRTYRYVVLNVPVKPALLRKSVAWESKKLSVSAMRQAVKPLLGEHDFSSFRAAGCHSTSPWRSLYYVNVFKINEMVVFEICANAFLLHMIRIMVGVLLAIGRGEKKPEWMGQLLGLRDRTKATVTAPAEGLYLVSVSYPASFNIPELKAGPSFVGRELSKLAYVHKASRILVAK
jgi:tRNA pseudouridine38-40 synthase